VDYGVPLLTKKFIRVPKPKKVDKLCSTDPSGSSSTASNWQCRIIAINVTEVGPIFLVTAAAIHATDKRSINKDVA